MGPVGPMGPAGHAGPVDPMVGRLYRVLVVDDEEPILELVGHLLRREGYQVLTAADGLDGLRKARDEKPDLVILDVMLPGVDGLSICRALRGESSVPILMLTARAEEPDRVIGLELGADDYVVKPFSNRELVARVKTLLRREEMHRRELSANAGNKPAEMGDASQADNGSRELGRGLVHAGPLALDFDRYEAAVDGRPLDLTLKEFQLLSVLVANRGRVMTRDSLIQKVWGYDYLGAGRHIDVHIRHLRQKIEKDPAAPILIETVYGLGYRFRDQAAGGVGREGDGQA